MTTRTLSEALDPIACPLCRETRSSPWGAENGYQAVKCAGCGLVYVNPRPRLAQISEANKIGEHATADGTLDVVFRRHPGKLRHYRRIVAQMFRDEIAAGAPMSWLDVGAGFGELVEVLQGILPAGSRVEGIEPMRQKAAHARERGLPVHTATLPEVRERFDVVSLINVFSHLPDFDAFLGEIRGVLRPGGTLFLETGNGGDLDDASGYPDVLFLPDHLVFAGIGHMRTFLERNGLQVTAVEQRRVDTPAWVARNLVRRVLGKPVPLRLPHTLPFRTMFIKARAAG